MAVDQNVDKLQWLTIAKLLRFFWERAHFRSCDTAACLEPFVGARHTTITYARYFCQSCLSLYSTRHSITIQNNASCGLALIYLQMTANHQTIVHVLQTIRLLTVMMIGTRYGKSPGWQPQWTFIWKQPFAEVHRVLDVLGALIVAVSTTNGSTTLQHAVFE